MQSNSGLNTTTFLRFFARLQFLRKLRFFAILLILAILVKFVVNFSSSTFSDKLTISFGKYNKYNMNIPRSAFSVLPGKVNISERAQHVQELQILRSRINWKN